MHQFMQFYPTVSKNDYPLIICYQVGSLGEIRLCLAPKANES